MEHLAIDLGARESQVCVRAAEGTIVLEMRCATAELRAVLSQRPPSRVVLETCAEAFAVAALARELGHEAVVVPASLVRALGVGARGVKTDVRDARHLSAASCRMARLPAVHVPDPRSQARKAECALRETLVEARTKLVNAVRGWLRSQAGGPLPRCTPATLPARVRAHLARQGHDLPPALARLLTVLETLTEQVRAADAAVTALAREDAVCRRLMTVPGVGPVTAVRFVAAVDDVRRFPHAHAVQAYLGLVPGEDSSADRRRLTAITKAGPSRVRWTLVQAAWCARRLRPHDPAMAWARRVEARRGRPVAAVALARKLAGILYALWRDGTVYDPQHHGGRAQAA
jgi:transposase